MKIIGKYGTLETPPEKLFIYPCSSISSLTYSKVACPPFSASNWLKKQPLGRIKFNM